MRLPKFLPVFVALILGALMSVAGAAIGANIIEKTSEKAVASQLNIQGFEWAEVEGDGLQIVLTGTAPTEIDQLAAQRAAGHVVDSARVLNVMSVAQKDKISAPKFSIEILRNDDGVSLIGLVPSTWDKQDFINGIKKETRSGSVADLLEQANYPIPDGWEKATKFGAEAIGMLPRSKISLSPTFIRIEGLADSNAQKAFLETALARSEPQDIRVRIAISAPRPVISPFTVRFLIDEKGPRFDACAAETAIGHARILATARAMGIENPECVVGLGAPTTRWASAVEESMRAVSELGGGSVTLSDNEVTIVGVAGQDKAAFNRVVGELDAALPDSFTLHGNLPKSDSETENDQNAQLFVATRSPQGQVQLRGMVQDERSKAASEAVARANFGSDAVYSATRVDEELPNGWSERVLATIDALGELSHGSAVMSVDNVTIRGETGQQNARAEISRLLADKLGEGQNFEIDVRYIKKLDPTLNIPTPDECVARANDVLNATKIVFAPGSADVDASSFETLDKIAAAFKNCEDVAIEIGGHTDSQGREEMNQSLSQSRANSIVDALLARRVVGVDFTAKGYGETLPIADNDTEEGREDNRRIEFKLLGAETEDQKEDAEDAAAGTPE